MKHSGNFERLNAALAAVMSFAATISIGAANAAECPCDIYKAAGTPCVAAYSMVRALSNTYTGPLYQVRRTSDNQTKDIFALTPGGYANAAVQDSFLGSKAGTVSKLYDQSGKGNDLVKAPAGTYTGTASQPDYESDAKGISLKVGGHSVYGLYMKAHDGYRDNQTNGMPTGSQPQGIYEVVDGKRYGTACCWDFGNASTNNSAGPTGSMNTIFFGTGYWGKGNGNGPWFMADLEAGVWAGGSGGSNAVNGKNPSIGYKYAFGIVKSQTGNYAIRVGDAQSGNLITAQDGAPPSTWKMAGGIILGIGGDNSNSSFGTFFEGAITAGRPSDATDDAILKNVQAAGYGSNIVAAMPGDKNKGTASRFDVRYNSSNTGAIISFTLQDARHVTMNLFDQQGRRIAAIVDGIMHGGSHEALWDTKGVPPGVYVCRTAIAGTNGWSGKIIVGK